MAFFMKWTDEKGAEPQTSKVFPTGAEAEACGRYILENFRRKPAKIWIEGADGSVFLTLPAYGGC